MDDNKDKSTNKPSVPPTSGSSKSSSSGSNLTEHPIDSPSQPSSPGLDNPKTTPPAAPTSPFKAPAPPLNQPSSTPQPRPTKDIGSKKMNDKKPPLFNKGGTPPPPPNIKPQSLGSAPPPPKQNKDLEKKAEVMLKDLDKGSKPKSKAGKLILGIIALLVLGLGSFTAYRLLTTTGIGDVRQQAALDDYCGYISGSGNSNSTCVTITDPMVTQCANVCGPNRSPSLYVVKYQCSSNNLSGGCQDGGRLVTYEGTGEYCANDPGCGSVQIDVGCRDEFNTYGTVAWASKSYPEPCGGNPGTPPSTPPSTPTPELVCSDLNYTPSLPSLGDSVTFTCSGQAEGLSISRYRFRYSIGGASFVNLAPSSPGSAQSVALTIADPGDYTVQCSACSGADDTSCTAWQAAQ